MHAFIAIIVIIMPISAFHSMEAQIFKSDFNTKVKRLTLLKKNRIKFLFN